MSTDSRKLAVNIIRIAAASNMLIHGLYRLITGIIPPFDAYLATFGFFPPYTAWAITFFEIIAASLIIFNKWVVPLSIVFIVQLLVGIIMIHGHEGWFVVGGGRNGSEYSVLMIVCFVATIISHRNVMTS